MRNDELLWSAHRALLFNVTPNTRFIFMEVRANHIIIYVYSEEELNDEELDVYYSVAAEMEGDFAEVVTSEVYFFVTTDPFENVIKLEHLLYARYEYMSKK